MSNSTIAKLLIEVDSMASSMDSSQFCIQWDNLYLVNDKKVIINILRGGHTRMHARTHAHKANMYTNLPDKSNFKKPS